MTDYRLRENRREGFIRWFAWSLKYEDCDPALYAINYIFNRLEYNIEQRLWLVWLYANTYQLPTAFVIQNEFPDMELVGLERLCEWNTNNYKLLRYQTDTKYNKGHLPVMFESYKKWIGDGLQTDKFAAICSSNDPTANYKALWDEINTNLHKFGRYTAWFYIQALKHCCGLNVDAPDLVLHDYSGSKSHRNGLCYALGKDEWVNEKLPADKIEWLEHEARQIRLEVMFRFPEIADKADMFAFETAACQWKKIFREKRGRYLGYYLDRQAEEIAKVEADGWDGICWRLLWEARQETLRLELQTGIIREEKMKGFLATGTLAGLEIMFPADEVDQTNPLLEFV